MAVPKGLKKIGRGEYLYRGIKIANLGYMPSPVCHTVWEAYDEWGGGFGHSKTLQDCMAEIDWELEDPENIKRLNAIREEESVGIGGLVSVAVFFVGIGLLISFGDAGGLF